MFRPLFQNSNFRANWISRGLLTVLFTAPKLPDGRYVTGGPNRGWLKRLKTSVRNSTPILSDGPKVVLLNMAKSKLTIPCCRRLESTRGSFPKVKASGCEKQEVLNHSFNLDSGLPDISALQPGSRFGRAPAPNAWVGFEVRNFSGKPLCSVVTPSTPHPDTILAAGPVTPESNFLPGPNGRSST